MNHWLDKTRGTFAKQFFRKFLQISSDHQPILKDDLVSLILLILLILWYPLICNGNLWLLQLFLWRFEMWDWLRLNIHATKVWPNYQHQESQISIPATWSHSAFGYQDEHHYPPQNRQARTRFHHVAWRGASTEEGERYQTLYNSKLQTHKTKTWSSQKLSKHRLTLVKVKMTWTEHINIYISNNLQVNHPKSRLPPPK